MDDGIAMGHGGMLYSLPSEELIADCVEYMVNAHCADALVCISNCDKITPGIFLAALRLNVPTVFVSGGPMETGNTIIAGGGTVTTSLDLVDAMTAAVDESVSDDELGRIEANACPVPPRPSPPSTGGTSWTRGHHLHPTAQHDPQRA